MGCGSSKGVRVESTRHTLITAISSDGVSHEKNGGVSHEKNGGVLHEKNGALKIDTANAKDSPTIRGDRLSLLDARNRRESDGIDRRRRLSQLHADEVDKAKSRSRQNSGMLDRSSSSNSGEQTPVKEIKQNGSRTSHHSNGSLQNEKHHVDNSPKLEIKIDHASDTEIDLLSEKKQKRISDIQEHPIEVSLTDSESDSESQTQSRIKFQEKPNPRQTNELRRQSVDSVDIKNNANSIVNDVMSKAMFTFKTEEQESTSNLDVEKESSRTISEKNKNDTSMDEHAKNIVDNMLKRAVLQVSTDQNQL